MSTLRNINLNLELGQTILVGPNRDTATITKIEYFDKTGEVVLNTTKGTRKGSYLCSVGHGEFTT